MTDQELTKISDMVDIAIAKRANHNEPSTKTLQFMSEFSVKFQNLECKVDKLPTRDEMKLVIKEGIDEALKSCDDRYANKDEFKFIKRLVYGFIGIIILGTLYLVRNTLLGIK